MGAPCLIFSDLRESTARRVACLREAVWRYGSVRRVKLRHRTGRERRLSSYACEATARISRSPKSSSRERGVGMPQAAHPGYSRSTHTRKKMITPRQKMKSLSIGDIRDL